MSFFHNIMVKLGRYKLVPDRTTGEDYLHRYYLFLKDRKIAEFQEWRGPGSIIRRKANEYHWLELDPEVGPATTLFFMGKQQRDWGFLKGSNWFQWQDYLANKKQKAQEKKVA